MKYKIFVFLFMLTSVMPTFMMIFGGSENDDSKEIALRAPDIILPDGNINKNYLSEFSDYFDDSFGMREQMITINNCLYAKTLSKSGEEKVVYGKDGWLFYNETLDDYEGIDKLSHRQIYTVAKAVSLMNEYCKNNSIDFSFVIAPNKNSLYPQYMPGYYPMETTKSNADSLFEQLDKLDVDYINLFDVFKSENNILYRKTDSHWTTEGAGLAADIILDRFNKEHKPYYGSKVKEKASTGDLHAMLYPAFGDAAHDIVYETMPEVTYKKPMRSVEDNYIFTINDNKDGCIMVYRDSFGNTLYPFLAAQYGEAVFTRLIPYDLNAAINFNADSVLVEIVERNISWLGEKSPIFKSLKRDALPQVCIEVEPINLDISDSSPIEGTFKVSGILSSDKLSDTDNIYIKVDKDIYEAVPGFDGAFSAYIPDLYNHSDIKIYTGK